MNRCARVEQGRRPAFRRDRPNLSLAIEDERLAIARPIRRFEVGTFIIDYDGAPGILIDADGLKGAVEDEVRGRGGRSQGRQLDMSERGLLSHVLVVRAHANAGVEGPIEVELDGSANRMKGFAARAQEHGDGISALFEADAMRCGDVELDVLRGSSARAAILQSCHA